MIKKRKCSKCGREGHDAGWCSYDEPAPPSPPVYTNPAEGLVMAHEAGKRLSQPEQEPREWWISEPGETQGSVGWNQIAGRDIHVIEHAAYERVCSELEQTEKVYRMNREWIAEAKEKIAELERELEERRMSTPTMNAVHSLQSQLDSAVAAIGHLRAAAKKVPDAWRAGEMAVSSDCARAIGDLEHALACTSGYEGEEK